MDLFNKKQPEPIEVMNKPLVCPVCKNDHFWVRTAQLNKAVTTFFGFEWADQSATCFVCSECTHILWFLGEGGSSSDNSDFDREINKVYKKMFRSGIQAWVLSYDLSSFN
jgi:hypothetical protein